MMINRRFNRVAVLSGGLSTEREVSLRSGEAVVQGLRSGGYEVVEVDVTSKKVDIPSGVEAAFIALHGTFGEDGGIQKYLRDKALPFTGSGAGSCRISFDKILTRKKLDAAGIRVPRGEVLRRAADRTLAVPLVVKPPREGSSVGCHIVRREEDWAPAFADASGYSADVLVEEYIPGRELTVGVVEQATGDSANGIKNVALPVVEIRPAVEWYDYRAKYVSGDTEYTVPAELSDQVTGHLQAVALQTFEVLGAEGFGRVDFRLSPNGRAYVLELNAIPGFTTSSLLPKAAQAAGIGFSELCCRIMEMARLH